MTRILNSAGLFFRVLGFLGVGAAWELLSRVGVGGKCRVLETSDPQPPGGGAEGLTEFDGGSSGLR
jgi:hypothetical protein